VVDWLEISASGFFARSTPYLSWLAARYPCIVRAPSLSVGSPGPLRSERLRTVADICRVSNCRWVVHPLGLSESDDIRLEAPIPISLTPASLDLVSANMSEATKACGRPGLLEPITSLLRVPGTMGETRFLNTVCAQSGCRLLVDVTTLLVASRNQRFDPRSWLDGIDEGLIAAARIGGSAVRGGRWRRDAARDIDEAAWDLLRDLAIGSRPDLLILETSPPAGDESALTRDVERLRQLDGPTRAVKRQPRRAPDLIEERPPERRERTVPKPPAAVGADRIDIAPDVSFFVLDDHGVLLSESRHELVLFNTSAALLWCLLEDGVAVPGMVEAYRRAADVPHDRATRDVGGILQRWFGLGYTRTPVPSISPGMPQTTALAFVLTNARLRQQFREAPRTVAADLGVAEDETETFVRLDSSELDAQAAVFADVRSAWREQISPRVIDERGATAAGGGELTESASPGLSDAEQRYRLVSITFGVRCRSEAVAARVHEALGHLHSPASPPQILIDIRSTESGGWTVFGDGRSYRHCRSIDQLVPIVLEIMRGAAIHPHRSLFSVHAGVVSMGTGCVLLPAGAGSGKTTLTAGLMHAGATYFSDEIAILDDATLAATAVPLPLSVKDGSVAALRRLFPEVETLTPHLREDYQRVRYLPPPAAALALDRSEPVRWLVFPRYDPLAPTALQPMSRPAGLKNLLNESLVLPERLDRTAVAALVRWMRTVDCFELSISSLESAVHLVRALLLHDRAPGRP
jgi:uncharacterized protein (UPF0276 family)